MLGPVKALLPLVRPGGLVVCTMKFMGVGRAMKDERAVKQLEGLV